MNTTILEKHIKTYTQWYNKNKEQASQEQDERIKQSQFYRTYTKERILSMSEDDLYEYIAPLWAMVMWGNKRYQINNIIEANGMPLLQKQLANLIWEGNTPISKRWDDFRSKIKGIGPAIMSELLCKTHPDKFLIWNKKTYNGFKLIEIPNVPRYESRLTGKDYVYLTEKGLQILEEVKKQKSTDITDMLTLNTFIWQGLQPVNGEDQTSNIVEEVLPKNTKEATFVHNDIRDKLASIGQWLGFQSEIEKKVADGAIVDAVWEVTIGNMGRVIYVFEVQTAGSIDSLILNLMKAKNNKAVQGIIAVTDKKQIEKIKKEVASLPIKDDIKYWDYLEVLRVYESLEYVNTAINNLGLVPDSL